MPAADALEDRSAEEAARETPPDAGKAQLGARLLMGIVTVGVLAATVWYLVRPAPLMVQGTIDSVRMDIAARVNGRAGAPMVSRGQDVEAGQVIGTVENAELLAGLEAARAAQQVAEANLARINAGTRSEVIDQRRAAVASAEANKDLAQKTHERIEKLARDGFATQARLDQATDAMIVSSHTLEQARLAYDQAIAGFTKEDVEIAEANVAKAKADVEVLQKQVEELTIRAPIKAQVFQIDVEHGEFVLTGVPLLSLIDIDEVYAVFNMREDLLPGLKIGDRMSLNIPAIGRPVEFEIRHIAPRGEYSGWRSTRATGDFDLRTFEVRMFPTTPMEGLRPGMSAYFEWTGDGKDAEG